MTPFGQLWPSSWTTDSTLNGVTAAAGANTGNGQTIANSGASPNEVLDSEVSVAVTYGGTITGGGATISVCRRRAGGFQAVATDAPYGFSQTAVASTTVYSTFMVRGFDVADFQVCVSNPATNSTITVTVSYRQSQGQSG